MKGKRGNYFDRLSLCDAMLRQVLIDYAWSFYYVMAQGTRRNSRNTFSLQVCLLRSRLISLRFTLRAACGSLSLCVRLWRFGLPAAGYPASTRWHGVPVSGLRFPVSGPLLLGRDRWIPLGPIGLGFGIQSEGITIM